MNRKQRREAEALARKSGNKDLAEKIKIFSKLKDKCRVCESPFDKTNIEMLSTWMVVVREDEKKTNLYCPECWDKAQKIIESFNESESSLTNDDKNSKS